MEQDFPHFESKRLKNIRAFLRHCNAMIELDNPQVPAIQRINDQHIMDLVLDSKSFKPAEISHINRCRLYLQAHTLSDIAKASGVRLHPEFLQGNHTRSTPVNKNIHFNQKRPGPTAWRLWQRANYYRPQRMEN